MQVVFDLPYGLGVYLGSPLLWSFCKSSWRSNRKETRFKILWRFG
ncbi:4280_t:CDS:2 [Acaulospora morrowiae]|uniref:4280_t:CDS:1 n=1 Tax=Acaulospora morrowiae TaxID=94023 RepID=A0A9N8V7Z0_9GLOM|nr:4280_t:CDS:2 [Acaulospora morrowiae]